MKDLKELFVPYELALKLKEKGFDEPCLTYYYPKGKIINEENIDLSGVKNSDSNTKLNANYVAAPLYQQTIDWFRDTHNIYLSPEVDCENGYHQIRIYRNKPRYDYFQSCTGHYKALNKAIEEALKLV